MKRAPLAELDLFRRRGILLRALQGESPELLRSLRDDVFRSGYEPLFYTVNVAPEMIGQRSLPKALSSGETIWSWRGGASDVPTEAIICRIGKHPENWQGL